MVLKYRLRKKRRDAIQFKRLHPFKAVQQKRIEKFKKLFMKYLKGSFSRPLRIIPYPYQSPVRKDIQLTPPAKYIDASKLMVEK